LVRPVTVNRRAVDTPSSSREPDGPVPGPLDHVVGDRRTPVESRHLPVQRNSRSDSAPRLLMVRLGPPSATFGPVISVEFERVEALELLAMTLAHLKDAEARGELSPRVPLLMTIRDKLVLALREEEP
jgi:hypothetical protein